MSSKHKILFVNSNKAWGGGEKWHLETARYLRSWGFDVVFLLNTETRLADRTISTYRLKISKSSFLNPIKRKYVQEIIKKEQIDSVIVNLPQDFKLIGFAVQNLNLRRVIYRRGMPHPLKNSFINRYLITKIYTHLLANSRAVEESLLFNTSAWFPKEKIMLVKNGIRRGEIDPDGTRLYSKKEDELIIGNAGRLVAQKGQKYLITLGRILKDQSFKFKILIAGIGPLLDDLKASVFENDLEKNIIFLGHQKEMSPFFRSLDLFVFPSLFEGLPNTLIEAMAHGIPAIGFNLSSIPEVIKNDCNGYLVEPFDIGMMARLIMEKDFYAFRDNALRTVEQEFSYEKNILPLLDILA